MHSERKLDDIFLLGEIRLFPYCDVPVGWMKCEGQSLPMNEYAMLYMMIGSRFGEDPENKFRFLLPDLREKFLPGLAYCIAIEGQIPKIPSSEEAVKIV